MKGGGFKPWEFDLREKKPKKTLLAG